MAFRPKHFGRQAKFPPKGIREMRGAGQRKAGANASPATQLLLSPDQIPVTNRSAIDEIAFARAFAYRMASAWWTALTNGNHRPQALRELFSDLVLSELTAWDSSSAEERGKALACLDTGLAAYQIGLAYTSLLPKEHRGIHGIYYTPPALVRRLIDQASAIGVDWRSARVLDPACGGGAFLAPIAHRIIQELRDCSPRILVENIGTRLHGYELDPFGAWLSQVTLDAVLLPIAREAGKRLPVVVTVCDSLRNSLSGDQFDLVIGNPPYRRTRLDSAIRLLYQRSLYGHANLYGLFTDVALRQAKQGGIIAFVTPTSFLAGEYFKNLRALLACEAPPATIDFIAARRGIFEDVLQEALLATYVRSAPAGCVTVHEISPSNGEGLNIRTTGAIQLPPDPSQPWLLPRRPSQAALVARLTNMRHRLADWGYTVSTGPLVWNRHKDQLASRPGAKRFPLVWAESVTFDGRFIWRANKKNHAPYFEVRRGDDWLITNNLCVLVQRTTAKEQARRLVAASLPATFVLRHGAVVIENHLNMIRPTTKAPAIPTKVLAAFLNSTAADQAFRCVSGSVAVSAYELEALPLPAPEDMTLLTRLVREGALRDRIEAACIQLYSKPI
jgi:adenine-specific DNA-methyltransferase